MAAATVDGYLSKLDDAERVALEKLRKAIRSALGRTKTAEVEEVISYQIPSFRYAGRMLVGYGATSKHCAFYLMSTTVLAPFAKDLKSLDTSKGTIRFQPNKPLPATLVKSLVRARMVENELLSRASR